MQPLLWQKRGGHKSSSPGRRQTASLVPSPPPVLPTVLFLSL